MSYIVREDGLDVVADGDWNSCTTSWHMIVVK